MRRTWRPVRIGEIVDVRGVRCEVIRIRPAGCVDVAEIDGDRAWRIAGLLVEDGVTKMAEKEVRDAA